MLHSLALFHRIADQEVIVLGEGAAGEARRRLVERAGGRVVGEGDSKARLAFIALAEPEAVAARLKARGLLVNVADRPELCDFTVPSLLERGPVLVAVGTGGVSAGLAKALRLRLDALLPASLGGLAEALGAARAAMRQRWSDAGERRRALDAALVEGGPLDPLGEGGAQAVAAWLEGASATGGGLHEIVLASADPDDLTLRQARLLGSADVIACEPGVPLAILARGRADSRRIELAAGEAPPTAAGLVVVIRWR